MLTGALLGALLVILGLLDIYLWGSARAHKQAGTQFAQRAFAAEAKLEQTQKALAAVQTPYIIHFSDEQLMKLASMLVDTVHTLEDAKNAPKN